jgi:hypothetical protein
MEIRTKYVFKVKNMSPFSGEGKFLGNNIPHGQGKGEEEQQIQKEKVISECQTNPSRRR